MRVCLVPPGEVEPIHGGFIIRHRINWRGQFLMWVACDYCDMPFTEETKSYPDALLMLEALKARRLE
jgi:hypothetical protein